MRCSECHTDTADAANFCPNCGVRLHVDNAPATDPGASDRPRAPDTSDDPLPWVQPSAPAPSKKGFLQSFREASHERKLEHEQQVAERLRNQAAATYEISLSEWREADAHLQALLQVAKTFSGQTSAENPNLALMLKRNERAFWTLNGAGLVEPRRGAGHWQGGYSGFSFRIAKGVRYHVGGTRGHYVQGQEAPTVIDIGTATITDQRVVFQGTKQTREWAYPKLLGYQHFDLPPWTAIQVSNRQKTSGVRCDANTAGDFQFRLALALARYNGQVDQFVGQLQQQVQQHASVRPADPSSA